jgi:type III restriction enzyme
MTREQVACLAESLLIQPSPTRDRRSSDEVETAATPVIAVEASTTHRGLGRQYGDAHHRDSPIHVAAAFCEQVVGRGLRRASYEPGEDGLLSEEIAQVFGVPFEIVPFKGTGGAPPPKPKRFHVVALDSRQQYEIRFPRVEGYTQGVRNRVTVRDWSKVPTLKIVEGEYPTFVETRPYAVDATGTTGGRGPGTTRELSMKPYDQGLRIQRGIFQMASALTKSYLTQAEGTLPAHVLFPQLVPIVERFVKHHVQFPATTTLKVLFNAPFYGLAIESLVQHIVPDESLGEAPELPRFELQRSEGSTADVDYWTSKDVRETKKSHVN